MAPLIGFIILAIGALSIYRLKAERRISDALLWIILFFYAPFNALVIGIVRLNHDPSGAPRAAISPPVAISLIATIVLMLAALPKASATRRITLLRAAAAATLLIAAVVLSRQSRLCRALHAKERDQGPQRDHLPSGSRKP